MSLFRKNKKLIKEIEDIIKENDYSFNGIKPNRESICHFLSHATKFDLTDPEIVEIIRSMMKDNSNYLAYMGRELH